MKRKRAFLWLVLAALAGLLLAVTAAGAAQPDGVTVYDIQYTTDPGDGTYPSPYDGQVVTVDSAIVVAVYPDYYSGAYFIQDAGGGPWSGIMVFDGTYSPNLGDEVSLTAEVDEYYGFTELKNVDSLTVLSSGNALTVDDVNTADIPYADPDTSEPWESVLVAVHNVTVTDDNPGYGDWRVADASAVEALIGNEVDYGYTPVNGDLLAMVRGPLWYSYDEYQIEPRDADDVVEMSSPVLLQKEAPAMVTPGGLFTYTLSVMNDTGLALTHVVLTDALPIEVSIAELSDGGVHLGGNVVSWTIASLVDGATVTRTAVVTAPLTTMVLVNDDYVVWASNWPTQTVGAAVSTLVYAPGEVVPIHVIQGDGQASPLDGYTDLLVEAVVVGDFQTGDELSGFFLQEEDADTDADPATSEGIFCYDDGFGVDVNVGDVVRVQADVHEYYGLTELHNVDAVTVLSSGVTVTLSAVDLPVSAIDYLERYEGMWVTAFDVLYATETYDLGRYGEVWLSVGGRLDNPTNVVPPGAPALALQDLNDRSRLLVDDGSQIQNPLVVPYLAADNTLRLGDVATNVVGVLSYDAGFYRLQPTGPLAFERENERTPAPDDAGGLVTVASFNVLNYFNGDGQGGGFPTSRGANTPEEFARQRTKIISATLAIDADIIGLMEIENDGYGQYSAIQDLVNGLNDHSAPDTYAFIDFGAPVGTDEIIQGILYKPGTVQPIGAPAVLDSSVDPLFLDTKNRPVLAQTFEHTASGERLTVAVNHLKSKGSSCNDVGDPDIGDGQGNCNQTRTNAAIALTNWLATDPTGSGDPDALIIGDLNSYAMEDPIEAITTAGYIDLVDAFMGPGAYSYVFEGQFGYLDHALANTSLAPQVVGTTIWHINADEPRVLDYNQEYNPPYLYAPDAYRASDHDPVVVSLFPSAVLALSKEAAPAAVRPGGVVTYTLSLQNEGFGLAQGVALTDVLPAAVVFDQWLVQDGATVADRTLTWSGTLSASQAITISFTAIVTDDAAYYGLTITNTASFTSTNGGGGSAQAAFDVTSWFRIYLPVVKRGD